MTEGNGSRRHYGFMAHNCRTPLQRIRELICLLYELIVPPMPDKEKKKKSPPRCRHCRSGILRYLEFVPCPRGSG